MGIAALDVGIAVKTITDPKASIAAKVTSGITALGSVAAATNIPIVSQVGAAVSLASTAVGAVIENVGAIKAWRRPSRRLARPSPTARRRSSSGW